jgi:hypothetical protein
VSLRKLRTQDHYKAVARELAAAGLTWREEFRGKHACLVISVNGREETEIISITPSDHRAPMKARARIRRRIKEWKAETGTLASAPVSAGVPTLEVETTVDSTFDLELRELDGEPRALDIDLALRLGFTRPRDIRKLIERNMEEIQSFGTCATVARVIRGNEVTEYWLNEEQALLVASMSDAEHAAKVRRMVIKVFVAWRRGQLQVPEELTRVFGIVRQLNHKVTETEKAVAEIQNYLTNPGSALVPSFNFAGSVTALEIITMAGVPADQRVRGTSLAVTLRMKDFCLDHGLTSVKTPSSIDASERRRFPRDAAQQWLTGPTQGAEFIRGHVAKRRAERGAMGQMSLILGGKR